jgi:hypothetical protein
MSRLGWAGVAVVATVLEVDSLRKHDGATLSEVTRDVFRTHTAPGRIAFLGFWAGLSVLFVPHILRGAAVAASAVVVARDDMHDVFDLEETS